MNINAIAEECMRISYHGLLSKEKTFNCELITRFDPGLPKIEVVQQDIGRVFLNLFNNAFYAVHQKQKTAGEGADYATTGRDFRGVRAKRASNRAGSRRRARVRKLR